MYKTIPFFSATVCVALFSFLFPTNTAFAVFLSSSKLDLCTSENTAANSNTSLNCQQKFVLTLSIEGGEVSSDSILTWGQTLDANTQQQVTLAHPLHIRVTRSAPKMLYPLYYERDFNAQPYEVAIYRGLFGCDADANDAQPTCGRQVDPRTGAAVPYSEGYCCSCSLCNLLQLCDDSSRANTNCNLFGDAQTASCLRFNELWYSGYRIGPALRYYTITVNITDDIPGGFTRVLEVSPSQPGARSNELDLSATLVGDFSAFVQPWDLTQHFLFAPSEPLTHPRVAQGIAEWLLVPAAQVTVDGNECNKIGVSHEGFVTQGGDRCKLHAGSCTQNQLEDLRSRDVLAKSQGRQPLYFTSAYGDISYVSDSATKQPYLAFIAKGVGASVLTLSFAADRVAYVTNVASGVLLSVNVSNTISSASRDGRLYVSFLNTGNIGAKFIVSVIHCASTTFPLVAEIATVAALQVHTVSFAVSAQTDSATGEVQQCNVTLYDALYRIADSRLAQWNATAITPDRGPQGGDGGNTDGTPVTEEGGSSGMDCPSCPWYNPLCFLQQQCFWGFLLQMGTVAGLVLLIFLLIRLIGCLSRWAPATNTHHPQANEPVVATVLDVHQSPMGYAFPPSSHFSTPHKKKKSSHKHQSPSRQRGHSSRRSRHSSKTHHDPFGHNDDVEENYCQRVTEEVEWFEEVNDEEQIQNYENDEQVFYDVRTG